jgi:hypothetical protein
MLALLCRFGAESGLRPGARARFAGGLWLQSDLRLGVNVA